jgi:MinD superfamily P-loop ATPase
MNTIAVTGGKGGTGKSSVAILLAFKYMLEGRNILLVDCDVECPNLSILLGRNDLQSPIKNTFTFYPQFDTDKCLHCGLCVDKCQSGALFEPKNKTPQLKKDLCSSCGVCWHICPHDAITKKKEQNGEIFQDEVSDNLTLVTGRSLPGVRETSPVVKQVRQYISEIKNNYGMTIIDTAAGTHCTVMSALDEVDLAYAVTEPTPVGAHDLNLILEVLKVLKVESKIIVNKSDVGSIEPIKNIAHKHRVKISAEVLYKHKFAQIYAKGDLLKSKSTLAEMLKFD